MIDDRTPPPPPPGLADPGRDLWHAITSRWHLDNREVALLGQASATADLIARLEELLTKDGLTVAGSTGQPRLNQVVTEIRQQRLTLDRLLSSLSLPPAADEAPRVSRRSELAARRRWDSG